MNRTTGVLISICFLCPEGCAWTRHAIGRATAATSADRSGDKSLRGVRRLKDAGGTGQVRLFLSDSIENRMY